MEDNLSLSQAVFRFAIIVSLFLFAAAVCTLEQASY